MFDKVLIIEDSLAIAQSLQQQLFESFQLQSHIAATLTDAQTLIDQHPSEYFIASVDLQLPDCGTGAALDLVAQFHIPAIVYTGQKDPEIRQRFSSHGLVDYVFKDSARSLYYISWLCHRVLCNQNMTVLIVDDSPSALATLAKLMENQNFQILTANSRKEALQHINDDTDENIDIIILDQFLSDTMGYELCSEIRGLKPNSNIQIMGVSSKGGKDDAAFFLKCGGDDFLLRPFNPEEFIHRINHKADYIEQVQALKRINQEKDKFWGMATHDLRNPLGAILQVAKQLAKPNLTPIKIASLTDIILKSADSLQVLLDDLLNLSALESGKLTLKPLVFNLSDLVNERLDICQPQAQEKNINLKNTTPKSAMIEADPTRITQVIDNLLSNAIKYSPRSSQIHINIDKEAELLRFNVVDQGEGIQEKDTEKLFKTFNRLGHKTTGGKAATA